MSKKSFSFLYWVQLFLFCLLMGCNSSRVLLPSFLPEYHEVIASPTLQIPYPILLLHGLGQKATVWNKNAISFYEKDLGLYHAGLLTPSKKGISIQHKNPKGNMDFFTVQFSNPVDSVEAWVRELEQCIQFVKKETGAEKVILIGYSMGGLTGRHYLTKHLLDHHVQRLITIGSPHQGSAFAKVWNWKTNLIKALENHPDLFSKTLLEQGLELLRNAESDVPFHSAAIRDLRRPEDGGWFVQQSGKKEHPLDVEYISVIGDVDISKEIAQFNKSGAQELMRRVLGIIGFGIESLFESGDGVVSTKSQTINELPWFQSQPGRQRISHTIKLQSVHEEHLKNSNEIQKISLEDQPEFKGAEIYRDMSKNSRVLVIDYIDYLPKKECTVSVSFISKEKSIKVEIDQDNMSISHRGSKGMICSASIDFPSEFLLETDIECLITIKNSFGKQCTGSKMWKGI